MTWAREHARRTQQAITDAYTSIGRELGATVVPVGLAWQTFPPQHRPPALHDKDRSHPTLAGSYLAACVFYSVLFGESPEGIEAPVEGLGDDERGAAARGGLTRGVRRRAVGGRASRCVPWCERALN